MNTPFQQLCLMYLTELREARQHALATDELSLRPALDRFLKAAAEQIGRPIVFLSEAKKDRVRQTGFHRHREWAANWLCRGRSV